MLLLDDIVEDAYQDSPISSEEAYDELGSRFFEVISKKIGERILKCGAKVPVVSGKGEGIIPA